MRFVRILCAKWQDFENKLLFKEIFYLVLHYLKITNLPFCVFFLKKKIQNENQFSLFQIQVHSWTGH